MHWNHTELHRSYQPEPTANLYTPHVVQKSIEMYVFINLLCPTSWSLEPYIKKLVLEYGKYMTIRPIINSHLRHMKKDNKMGVTTQKQMTFQENPKTVLNDNDLGHTMPKIAPWLPSFAIKAAELQGKNAGRTFLRKVQERLFFTNEDISEEAILIDCAVDAKLDVDEFKNDLYSKHAKRAYQCDIELSKEMGVEHTPTIVFFNKYSDQHGIRLHGLHSYDVYVQVLTKILQKTPIPNKLPELEEFLARYKIVANNEIAMVFDWSLAHTATEMKKLQLKQQVREIPLAHGSYWEYIANQNS